MSLLRWAARKVAPVIVDEMREFLMNEGKDNDQEEKEGLFSRKLEVSSALAAIIGPGPMTRTRMMEKLWGYIHDNDLQDPHDGRMINADEKLERVFGKDRVSMFEMTKLINNNHLD